MAASYNIGVLHGAPGWRKGKKSGGSCSRQSLSWRAPISSIPKPAVTRFDERSTSPKDQGSLFQAFEAEDEVVR